MNLEINKCSCCNQIIKEKKPTYTEAQKRAIYNYKLKNPNSNKKNSNNNYHKNKDDPEWKQKFNERCRINNAIYRERKLLEKMINIEN